jgi:ADP-heptose:LPS heptosyltransferase
VIVAGGGMRGIVRLVKGARARSADLYLVPFPSNRWQYSMLSATSGAKKSVLHGYPVGYFRALHFLPATRVEGRRGIHDVQQNLALLAALGIEPHDDDAPSFAVSDVDRQRAEALLRDAEYASADAPVVVHAGSAATVLARAKRWPAGKYAALIRALDERFPNRVVLVEGPDEAGVADEIRSASSGAFAATVVPLRGSIGDAAALLERSAMYVGSDSGLAHLAAAVGTTPVTIFGPADPDRVCAFGYRDLVVQSPRNCSPCFLYPWDAPYPKIRCKPPFCIESITVEQVMNAVSRASATIARRSDPHAPQAPSISVGR